MVVSHTEKSSTKLMSHLVRTERASGLDARVLDIGQLFLPRISHIDRDFGVHLD